MTTDPVPEPLGWCATCLAQNEHEPAVTLLNGTAVCAMHAGAGEVAFKMRHD